MDLSRVSLIGMCDVDRELLSRASSRRMTRSKVVCKSMYKSKTYMVMRLRCYILRSNTRVFIKLRTKTTRNIYVRAYIFYAHCN